MTEREIERISVVSGEAGESYHVGYGGITRIEEYTENGEYCAIPYLCVWRGENRVAEFCKHAVVGVYFKQPESTNDR